MDSRNLLSRFKAVLVLLALSWSLFTSAQKIKDVQIPSDMINESHSSSSNSEVPSFKDSFWSHVQFGGGFALVVSAEYTEVGIAPSAIYIHNKYLASGFGLQGSYVDVKGRYNSIIYGANIIELINPIPQIQLSLSISESRVNNIYDLVGGAHVSDNFWVTGLYLGAGYCAENVTIGLTYNVLHDDDKGIYSDAFMPFVRVYF